MEELTKYSLIARSLHWLSAVIIIWATLSGIYISAFEVGETLKHHIADFNVSLTTLFIPVFILRVAYRLIIGGPDHDFLTNKGKLFAEIGHLLIYLLIASVLITGVLMMGEDISIFNVWTIPHLLNEEKYLEMFSTLHKYSTVLLGLLTIVHILAVIKHQKNGIRILQRMA